MKAKRGARRLAVAALVVAFLLAGGYWGGDIVRFATYRYHESIDLPDGAGRVTFSVRRDAPPSIPGLSIIPPDYEPFSVVTREGVVPVPPRRPPGMFYYVIEDPHSHPFLRIFFHDELAYVVIFPGAEAAMRDGGVPYVVVEDLEITQFGGLNIRDQISALIEDRAARHPEIDWEPYRANFGS